MDGLAEAAEVANLGELNSVYARFRPFIGDEDRGPRQSASMLGGAQPAVQLPSHKINLDSGELFSQLCTVTNLVKIGPRNGLFSSIANVTDTVIRVWRDWLQREAAIAAGTQQRARSISSADDPSILWTDSSKTVGLKFRVVEDESIPAPVLFGRDDEPSVSFSLEYEGEIARRIRVYRPTYAYIIFHRAAYKSQLAAA